MEILTNPWVVGIGGGILSGLIVTLISRVIFSRRDNREYVLKVGTANREVIDAIRPGISEGAIPSSKVVESMIFSTARKYGIEIKDMLNPRQIAEDLVKEVMDSDFVSAKTKTAFCEELAKLTPIEPIERPEVITTITTPVVREYRERTLTLTSMMMGLFAALMTFTVAFSQMRLDSAFSEFFRIFLPTVVATVGLGLASYFVFIYRNLERRRQQRETKEQSGEREEE